MRKQITLCTIGTIFEWYEFSLFACLAPILSQIFFQQNNTTALMATFTIFASGYLMRPLGAIFFGQLGDRLGRKYTLVITIFAMTFATTAIGLIPTGSTLATALLVIFRLIQGFATSGEYPGGLTLLAEQNASKKSFIASFAIFGTGAGCFSGALMYFILLKIVGQETMLAWGWRIPFLLGAPLGVIGYLLRRYTLESPAFVDLKKQGTPLKLPLFHLLTKHYKTLLIMLGISSLTNTLIYVNFLYLGSYLFSIHRISAAQVIYLNLMVTFIYSISILFFGYLADLINKKIILLSGCLLMAASSYILFHCIMNGSLISQFAAQAVISVLIGMILGPFASILPAQFPTALRYTGVSITLNFAATFFGGSAPLICTWLVERTHSTYAPSFYLIGLAIIASIGLLYQKVSTIRPIVPE